MEERKGAAVHTIQEQHIRILQHKRHRLQQWQIIQLLKEATPYFLLTRCLNSTSLIGHHTHTLHFSLLPISSLYDYFLKSILFSPLYDLDFMQGGFGSDDKMQSVELDSTGSTCWILRSKINTRWISHQRRHLDLPHCSWVLYQSLSIIILFNNIIIIYYS